VLLASAGLVLRSFSNLLAVDPGFQTAGVLTLDIGLPPERYREVGALQAFYQRAFEAIRHLPGVDDAGSAVVVPLTGNNWTVPFERQDQPVAAGERPPDVGWQAATGGYFSTLRIPLRAGRLFNEADGPSARPVVIVSEAIQQRFFGGVSAVGRKVKLESEEAEIVGVVGNIRRAALTDEPRADMYFSIEQGPSAAATLFVRTSGDPRDALAPLRDTLRRLEPLVVVRDAATLDQVARESMQVTRLAMWLLAVFAAAALALAAVGIYGVMAYSVRQRTREIGTRLALGATPRAIQWLVMRDGIRVAALGAAIGVGASGYKASSPVWEAIRKNLGYARSYSNRINMAAAVPRGDLASTGYALAVVGTEYLVFQPSGGSVSVNLAGVSGVRTVEWFNPSNGQAVIGASVNGGGWVTISAPFSGASVAYIHP